MGEKKHIYLEKYCKEYCTNICAIILFHNYEKHDREGNSPIIE